MNEIEAVEEVEVEEKPPVDQDILRSLAIRLGGEFDSVSKQIESDWKDEWVESYRQYSGKYTEEEETRFDSPDHTGSRIFMNITRPKTTTGISHLLNVVHPTDGRNFGVKASPYNEDQAKAQAAAKLMQQQIDDRFEEGGYVDVCRKVIKDGAIYGTGVIKGPVLTSKVMTAWMQSAPGQFVQQVVEEFVPVFVHVRPWNFFPVSDEEAFEREYLTRSKLQKLAKLPGIIHSEMQEVLSYRPDDEDSSDVERDLIQDVEGLTGSDGKPKYLLVRYNGPIKVKELLASGEFYESECSEDLDEVSVEAWFIGPYCIKLAINPLSDGTVPYSVFCWEESDASKFGHGIPYLLRNPQRIVNSSARMILDNGGLSVGPQVVIDKSLIKPQDGNWAVQGNSGVKIWVKKESETPIDHAFKIYRIDNHQTDLANIYRMGMQAGDTESSIPLIAQGAEGTHTTQTKGGIAMLINQTNIATKNVVKNYDSFTKQNVERQYAWEMEYNERNEIKHDYHIDAKGSSELLTQETQAQNIMALNQLAATPQYQSKTNFQSLYEKTVEAMQFDKDSIVLTPEQQKQAQEQKGPPQPSFDEQIKIGELELNKVKLEMLDKHHADKMESQRQGREVKLTQLLVERQNRIMELSVKKDISLKEAASRLDEITLEHLSDRTKIADQLKANLATGSEFR